MLNNMAHQKPSTLKPFTQELAIMMMSALMTSKNRPNVSTVNGIVRSKCVESQSAENHRKNIRVLINIFQYLYWLVLLF